MTSQGRQITHGDVRVSAGGLRPVHLMALQRDVDAWVQAIMQRYAARQGGWSFPSLMFRQTRLRSIWHHVYHRTQIHLAPRLTLTGLTGLLPPSAGFWSGGVRAPSQLMPQLRVHQQVQTRLVLQRFLDQEQPNASEPLGRHLATRGTRLDTVATVEGTAFLRPQAQEVTSPRQRADTHLPRPTPLDLPVMQVVRRVAANKATAGEATGDAMHPAVSAPHAAVPVPLDLNHLTEQVIQTIDRRITAQRERLGRS